ncbi:MAG TPA: alpha/beta fold hydrolase [Acidimicrobiales bacterium]|nr:alpha/beta fold hydrolase [Acidimicrobiales bacterium]
MSLLTVQREGAGAPFAWLHGFTQTRTSAHEYRSILAGTREVWTLDLPGHGDAHAVRATLKETADLVVDALGEEPIDLGGYSFGARVALHVALAHPSRVRRLVLLGASRGIEDPVARGQRRLADEQLAQRIEEIGADAFLAEWLAQPLFATLRDVDAASRSRDSEGLAASLRLAGTGTQAWLAPRLAEIAMPVLALAGSLDAKFVGEASAIAAAVANGRFALVEGAGHAAHLERPATCATLVEDFLSP